jgi:2-dehydro-3-deoxy-D-arabinonate dehydratase
VTGELRGPEDLPFARALIRLMTAGGPMLAVWDGERALRWAADGEISLDRLMAMEVGEIDGLVAATVAAADPLALAEGERLVAPVASQEVWASGVTYARSREARISESTVGDVYESVYVARRPELFFKAPGWRVVGPSEAVGVRADSAWNVPEPELAVLMNHRGDVVAYACGNDMSSRSIESENPLYLPQAKIYDRACAIGPAAVLASGTDPSAAMITMTIERSGASAWTGRTSVAEMVRDPGELCRVVRSAYTLPHGAWLLTGTGLVPGEDFTLAPGDRIGIAIDGLGTLSNVVESIEHSGAEAPPRLDPT